MSRAPRLAALVAATGQNAFDLTFKGHFRSASHPRLAAWTMLVRCVEWVQVGRVPGFADRHRLEVATVGYPLDAAGASLADLAASGSMARPSSPNCW